MADSDTIVFFDIDYTLFNTDYYRDLLYSQLAKKLGIADEIFPSLGRTAENSTKEEKGFFDPETFLVNLMKHAKQEVELEELRTIFWNKSLFEASLYEDTHSLLQELSKKVTVGIFSTGDRRHQQQKIEAITKYIHIDHVYIFQNKLPELKNTLANYAQDQVYIVDDLPMVLNEVKKLNDRITTIWIKRNKKYEDTQAVQQFAPDKTIHSLSELNEVLH